MKKFAAAALLVTLLAGCGTTVNLVSAAPSHSNLMAARSTATAPATPAGAHIDPKAFFNSLDVNHDGVLTIDEYQRLGIFGVNGVGGISGHMPSLAQMQQVSFDMFDSNRDGKLTYAEFNKKGFASAVEKGVYTALLSPTTLVKLLDRNHDGAITPDEWQYLGVFGVCAVGGGPGNPNPSLAQLQQMTFDMLDTSHTGSLNAQQIATYSNMLAAHVPASTTQSAK